MAEIVAYEAQWTETEVDVAQEAEPAETAQEEE